MSRLGRAAAPGRTRIGCDQMQDWNDGQQERVQPGRPAGPVYRFPVHRPGRIDLKRDFTPSRTRDIMATAESTPAAMNWSSRLPAVGSIYIRGLVRGSVMISSRIRGGIRDASVT